MYLGQQLVAFSLILLILTRWKYYNEGKTLYDNFQIWLMNMPRNFRLWILFNEITAFVFFFGGAALLIN